MGLWECGQSKPGPRHGRKRRKGLSTFPRPEPKRILYEKAPQGCCGMESAEPGPAADSGECGKRGQSGPRTRNPNAARIRIVHRLSTLSAPPRTKNSRTLRETEKKTERRKTSRPNPATQPRTKTDPQQSAPDAIPPEFRRPRDTVAWLGNNCSPPNTEPKRCARAWNRLNPKHMKRTPVFLAV